MIKQIIAKMLKENTGTHFLDSGGHYGRHWQKNQTRQFTKEKFITWNEYSITKNVYHYLVEHLDITPKSKYFQTLYNEYTKNSDEYYLTDMENFADYLIENNLVQSDNYLITKQGVNDVCNTYNYENLLSQVLQYIMFYDGQDYFIILQLHNGCDVRGGYTKPRIFQLTDAESFIFQQRDITINTKQGNNYFTDDTYHFYRDGSTADGTFTYDDVYKEGIESAY